MAQSTHKKAFRSGLFKAYELIINTSVSILLTPFIIKEIGIEAYGIWLLIMSIGSWSGIVNLGITPAIQRSYGDAVSNNDHSKISFIFSNAAILLFIMGLVPFIAFLFISHFPEWFEIWPKYYVDFSFILIALSFQLFSRFMMNCINGLFAGTLRLDLVSKVDIIFAIIRTLAILGLLYKGYGLLGLALSHISSNIISDFIKLLVIKKMFPKLKFNRKSFSISFLKDLFKYAIQVFKNQLANMLSNKSLNIIISKTGNFTALGPFGLYRNLSGYYGQIVTVPVSIYSALIVKIHFRNHKRLLRLVIHEAILVLTYLAFTVGLLITAFSDKIIVIWIGPEITSYAVTIYFFILIAMLQSASRPLLSSLHAAGNLKALPNISMFLAIISVAGNIYIIKNYGVKFAPCMLFISQIFSSLIILPCLIDKTLHITWFHYYFRIIRLSSYFIFQFFYITPYIKVLPITGLIELFKYISIYAFIIFLVTLLDLILFERKAVRQLILVKKVKHKLAQNRFKKRRAQQN